MANLIPSDLTLGTGQTVGKYFGLVSAVPSLVLALWVYLLLVSGVPRADPSWARVVDNISHHPSVGLGVAAAALVLALVLHPLQFSMVQVLEGYWSGTKTGRALSERKIAVELNRYGWAERRRNDLLAEAQKTDPVDRDDALLHGSWAERSSLIRVEVERAAQERVIAQYPVQPAHVMPTRLGNVLRRHELAAGAAYGLPALALATHIGLVADPVHVAYLQDQRQALDLSARLTVSGILGALVSSALLWPHGLWLLLALIPYSAAYLCYRGSVTSAAQYGAAIIAVTDLNRFKLYAALHMSLPSDSGSERAQNGEFMRLLAGADSYRVIYAGQQIEAATGAPDVRGAGALLSSSRLLTPERKRWWSRDAR